jgi:succinate dehydrogenase / fumarate reductase, cytochrome b subunit
MSTKAVTLLDTSIGKKIVMAVTGMVLFGFTIGHTIGNLLIFAGRDMVNAYSAAIHHNLPLLWGTRVVLLVSVGLHVLTSVQLTLANNAARPTPYKMKAHDASSYASRTMFWSGPIILVFLLYHLAHLTFGMPAGNYEHSATDVYANLTNGFRVPVVALFYAAANAMLGLHLRHGAWSFLQSLGLNHPRYNDRLRFGTLAFATLVTVGNITIPLSVLAGVIQ